MSRGASSLTPASRARVLAAWRLYASGNRDLGEDVAHVHVDSARAQEEIERDLTIGAAHCHQSDNLELARRVPVAAPVDAFAELRGFCASTTGQRARVELARPSQFQHGRRPNTPGLRLLEVSSGEEPSSACTAGRAPPPDREAQPAPRAPPIAPNPSTGTRSRRRRQTRNASATTSSAASAGACLRREDREAARGRRNLLHGSSHGKKLGRPRTSTPSSSRASSSPVK
jgi:hypothetical protein